MNGFLVMAKRLRGEWYPEGLFADKDDAVRCACVLVGGPYSAAIVEFRDGKPSPVIGHFQVVERARANAFFEWVEDQLPQRRKPHLAPIAVLPPSASLLRFPLSTAAPSRKT
jgi:hypothetical protein